MADRPGEQNTAKGLFLGGLGGTALGVAIATVLAARPAKAAPADEKLDYLIEVLTTLVPVLAELADNNARLIALFEQWLAAQGVAPPGEGVEVTVLTPWVAREPEEIYSYAIRTMGPFYSNKMIDWNRGKRLVIKVESSLDKACQIQLIGNTVDDMELATDIGLAIPCTAYGNISVGLAWDDWHPYVGVRITPSEAPTAGILSISAVVQE